MATSICGCVVYIKLNKYMDTKEIKKLKENATKNGLFYFPTEEELNKLQEGMSVGNIPSYLQVIINNQRIINDKLKELLK